MATARWRGSDDGERTDGGKRVGLLIFAFASLASVIAGSAILLESGASAATAARNPAAWLVGAIVAAGIIALGRAREFSVPAILLAIAGLSGSLIADGQEGVHRWIDIGPLHVNVAALLLPAAIVAFGRIGIHRPIAVMAAVLVAVLLVLQPDASQATAFLAAACLLLLRSPATVRLRSFGCAASALLVVVAWLRLDPLEPVPEVEQIFSLGWEVSALLAVIAALGLAAAAVAPMFGDRKGESEKKDAAFGLVSYFIVIALAPAAGAFPVPLIGLGMSFPVGYWTAVALLAARDRSRVAR